MADVSVVQFGGDLTPEQVLIDGIPTAKQSDQAVLVLLKKDGDITVSFSSGSYLEKIGMLQLAIDDLVAGMKG